MCVRVCEVVLIWRSFVPKNITVAIFLHFFCLKFFTLIFVTSATKYHVLQKLCMFTIDFKCCGLIGNRTQIELFADEAKIVREGK